MNYVKLKNKKLAETVDMMSDEDIIEFANEKDKQFIEALEEVYEGHATGLICVGPPGIGKTHESKAIYKHLGAKYIDLLNSLYEQDPDTKQWTCTDLRQGDGALIRSADYSNWALFADGCANNKKGQIIISDDNDNVMKDLVALSIMMKMTEHEIDRKVDYTKANMNNELRKYGVPSSYEYNGGLVVLTNFKMKDEVEKHKENDKSKSYLTKWNALCSRMIYLDMELDSPRVKRVYIENKIREKNIYTNNRLLNESYGRSLTVDEQEKMLLWIRKHQNQFVSDLDFRAVNDVARLIIRFGNDFEDKAFRKLCKLI
jgi:hypothetical protein